MSAKSPWLCSLLAWEPLSADWAAQKVLGRTSPSHSLVMCKCLAIGPHGVVAMLGMETCFCWQENTFDIYTHVCLLFGRLQKHSGFGLSQISVY